MIKSKFAIQLHILTLLADNSSEWLSSSYIAGSLNINPVLVRKEIKQLKSAGFVDSKEGTSGGITLLKKSSEIMLSDIFKVSKGEDNVLSFSKNSPNPKCPIGKKINENLQGLYNEIDDSIEQSLNAKSLLDFRNQF